MPALFLILLLTSLLQEPALTARDVVQKADANMRGNTSQAEMIITTVRPSWQREMVVKTWSSGNDYAMIVVKSPVKDKGVAFLKRKKEVWNWVPVLERSIKLPPSMMTQSWMGTDFTNDDLVKESSVVEDYDHTFEADTVINGKECYVVRMIPKPDAPIVWGKIILCVDKKDFVEVHSRFYDEEGELINIMNASDVRMMNGRLIPTRLEMIPVDKNGHKTILVYSSILYNKPIPESFFTLQQMKNLQ
jgi:hypothetical protein